MKTLTRACRLAIAVGGGAALIVCGIRVQAQAPGAQATAGAAPASGAAVTFDKDVAPLVFDRCASCHQPGGLGPFSVLTYASTRQHATQIAQLTKSGAMPPWRAVSDFGGFVGQDHLTAAQIDLLQRWVEQGAVEGDPRDLPPAPKPTGGWELGTPDLIVTIPQPYMLPAEGTGVFRNFVIPVPTDRVRYVKGLEFHAGNLRVVHHANVRIDPTGASRRLDEEDPLPGYDGIIPNAAVYPDGHFLAWTPGQVPPFLPKGLAWRLDPGSDINLEVHMYPSGRVEPVQPEIGLFFTDDPPQRTPTMIRLARQNIDIPAGDKNYVINDSYVLPVDVQLEAIQPHAHFRAHDILATATLPTGETKTLLHIADWDYNFQHLYRYNSPFWLPKGTTIAMRYQYDNSADNPRNPDHPPQHVLWGPRATDEMGHIGIQVFTKTDHDFDVLNAQMLIKGDKEDVIGYERVIQLDPKSIALHDDVAGLYLALGQPDKAVEHFGASAKLEPESAAAHFNLGLALTMDGKMDEAVAQYRQALAIKPDYALAHNNLGSVLLQRGLTNEALPHFREAVRLDPSNPEAQDNLGRVCRARGEESEAVEHFRKAIELSPDWVGAIDDLAWLLSTARTDGIRDGREAVRLAEHGVDLTGRHDPATLDVLAAAYAEAGDFERAISAAQAALQLEPPGAGSLAIRERQEMYRQRKPYRRPSQ